MQSLNRKEMANKILLILISLFVKNRIVETLVVSQTFLTKPIS